MSVIQHLLAGIAAILLVGSAALLVAGIGAPGLWIALIAGGIAVVAIDSYRHRRHQHHV